MVNIVKDQFEYNFTNQILEIPKRRFWFNQLGNSREIYFLVKVDTFRADKFVFEIGGVK